MDNKKIGKLIASLRRSQGLTQQELGDKVGVGFRTVSKWERGINCPDIGIINTLSKILGISSDELLTGELDKTKISNTKKKIGIKTKIIISLLIALILLTTTFIIYLNNKTYVYKITSTKPEEYFVSGQVSVQGNSLTMIVNNIEIKEEKIKQTEIKDYEYNIKSKENYIYRYGYLEALENIEKTQTIKELLQKVKINFNTKLELTKKEIFENNIVITFNFIDSNNQEIIKELEVKLYK